jgi:hypothetical protein
MRRHILAGIAAAAVLAPGFALAQVVIEEHAPPIVGGTVGAAVVPAEVIGTVTSLRGPSVVVEERIAIGQPLPPRVTLIPVPRHRDYAYAIVNERRLIVEPRTRRVVHIIE